MAATPPPATPSPPTLSASAPAKAPPAATPVSVMVIVTTDAELKVLIGALVKQRSKAAGSLTSVTTTSDATLLGNINALINGAIGKAAAAVLAASQLLKAQASAIVTTPPSAEPPAG